MTWISRGVNDRRCPTVLPRFQGRFWMRAFGMFHRKPCILWEMAALIAPESMMNTGFAVKAWMHAFYNSVHHMKG